MVNRVLKRRLWVLTAAPLAAHHSFLAEYDADKLITKKADGRELISVDSNWGCPDIVEPPPKPSR